LYTKEMKRSKLIICLFGREDLKTNLTYEELKLSGQIRVQGLFILYSF
jgi:hypothetical protein